MNQLHRYAFFFRFIVLFFRITEAISFAIIHKYSIVQGTVSTCVVVCQETVFGFNALHVANDCFYAVLVGPKERYNEILKFYFDGECVHGYCLPSDIVYINCMTVGKGRLWAFVENKEGEMKTYTEKDMKNDGRTRHSFSFFLDFYPEKRYFRCLYESTLCASDMGALSLRDISLLPVFAGVKQVGPWWNFKHVISPFYRLYYVESGAARVCVDDVWYELHPGQLFLIPKYACHSYECTGGMNHYYICFFDDWVGNGVPRPDKMALRVQAEPYDLALMRRFLQLNPCMELVNVDPKVYNRAVYDGATCLSHARKEMESCGILMQLFSRFVTDECLGYCLGAAAGGKFDEIVNYIHSHLDRHIPLAELADRACLTAGHFSKVFKQVMGTSPCLYIQNRRIKRAQTLLLTTNMTITQVAERVGIYSPAQFTRLFAKIAGCKPKDYRSKLLDCCY